MPGPGAFGLSLWPALNRRQHGLLLLLGLGPLEDRLPVADPVRTEHELVVDHVHLLQGVRLRMRAARLVGLVDPALQSRENRIGA